MRCSALPQGRVADRALRRRRGELTQPVATSTSFTTSAASYCTQCPAPGTTRICARRQAAASAGASTCGVAVTSCSPHSSSTGTSSGPSTSASPPAREMRLLKKRVRRQASVWIASAMTSASPASMCICRLWRIVSRSAGSSCRSKASRQACKCALGPARAAMAGRAEQRQCLHCRAACRQLCGHQAAEREAGQCDRCEGAEPGVERVLRGLHQRSQRGLWRW
jgi:hypothetical protein